MKRILSLMMAMSMIFGLQMSFADTNNEGFVEIRPVSVEVKPISVEINPISLELVSSYDVTLAGNVIELDVLAQTVDGVLMVPVNLVSEALGYNVTWNAETRSVELSKGAQWTSITIGENRYFQNKMAPWALSAAPVIIDGRTLVPVEFFGEILNQGFNIEAGTIDFTQDEFGAVIKEGFIKTIESNEDGTMTITTVPTLDEADAENIYLFITSQDTKFQKTVQEGDYIKAIVAPYMVMMWPPRVGAYVIY